MAAHRHLVTALVASAATLLLYIVSPWLLAMAAALGGLAFLRGTRRSKPTVEPEFLGNLSHEIRTPLNGILGLTQLLLRTKSSVDEREYLEMIKSSGESLLRLTSDMMDYAKIQAGKLGFDFEEFRLRKLVRQTAKTLAPQAHAKELELVYWIDPEVPDRVVGDPSRLRQVLSNLIVNAIKFTDEGEIRVDVSVTSSRRGGTMVRFTVTDTGPGIPQADQARIFQAFQQGHTTRARDQGGLGLGLTISRELVSAMGGSIGVESAQGKGSAFHFTVPFHGAQEPGDDAEPPAGGLSGTRVLVVDHSPSHRTVLARQLRSWGADVVTVAGREEALAVLDEAPDFSLLFLDSRLGDGETWTLIGEIRERSDVPGILMTFAHEYVDSDTLRSQGFVGHLSKPIAPSHLSRAIAILRLGRTVDRPDEVQTKSLDRLAIGKLKVLLAEDNPINRTVLVRMLEQNGSEVVAVEDGRAALERWQGEAFDILLLDVEMPEVDGLSVARTIRRKEAGSAAHLPIVAVTAHAREEDRLRCLDAGMDGFLSKPFDEEELLAAMRQALGEGPGATSKEVFNLETALVRSSGDPALLAELSELFLEEAPATLDAIARALAARDSRTAVRLAHRLKGALLTLSASRAADAALELENGPSTDKLDALMREIEELRPELLSLSRTASSR